MIEPDQKAFISLYPNPTRANFSILIPADEQLLAVRILDVQGREMYRREAVAKPFHFSPEIPEGLYLVEIETTQSYEVIRLIIH